MDPPQVCEVAVGVSMDPPQVCEVAVGVSMDPLQVCEVAVGVSMDPPQVCEVAVGVSMDLPQLCGAFSKGPRVRVPSRPRPSDPTLEMWAQLGDDPPHPRAPHNFFF